MILFKTPVFVDFLIQVVSYVLFCFVLTKYKKIFIYYKKEKRLKRKRS